MQSILDHKVFGIGKYYAFLQSQSRGYKKINLRFIFLIKIESFLKRHCNLHDKTKIGFFQLFPMVRNSSQSKALNKSQIGESSPWNLNMDTFAVLCSLCFSMVVFINVQNFIMKLLFHEVGYKIVVKLVVNMIHIFLIS